jgi:hypothetical protein
MVDVILDVNVAIVTFFATPFKFPAINSKSIGVFATYGKILLGLSPFFLIVNVIFDLLRQNVSCTSGIAYLL